MFTLITRQQVFEHLTGSTNWHAGFVKEVHFATPSSYDAAGEVGLLRVLMSLPEDRSQIELVSFETESYTFWPNHDLDEEKSAVIKRRFCEIDFAAFSLRSACVGYQKFQSKFDSITYYSTKGLYDSSGRLVSPYDVDWRSVMDREFRI